MSMGKYKAKWSVKGGLSCEMIIFMRLAFLLLPQVECHIPRTQCAVHDPVSILHKYYQPGDLLIPAVISQIYITSAAITFQKHPSGEEVEEFMYGFVYFCKIK